MHRIAHALHDNCAEGFVEEVSVFLENATSEVDDQRVLDRVFPENHCIVESTGLQGELPSFHVVDHATTIEEVDKSEYQNKLEFPPFASDTEEAGIDNFDFALLGELPDLENEESVSEQNDDSVDFAGSDKAVEMLATHIEAEPASDTATLPSTVTLVVLSMLRARSLRTAVYATMTL